MGAAIFSPLLVDKVTSNKVTSLHGAAIFSPLLVDKVTSNKVTSLHGVSHLFTFSPFHLLQAFHLFTFSRFHHFPFTDGFPFEIGKDRKK